MKKIVTLLLALAVGFSCVAQAPRPAPAGATRPNVKIVFQPETLVLMLHDLEPAHLRKVYGKAVQVKKATRNRQEPAVKDTILVVNTKDDKLEWFANKYNQFLFKADIKSPRLTFGHAIRVGSFKAVFCKEYKLPATFDAYLITDEGGSSLYFLFRRDVLTEVTFEAGYAD